MSDFLSYALTLAAVIAFIVAVWAAALYTFDPPRKDQRRHRPPQ